MYVLHMQTWATCNLAALIIVIQHVVGYYIEYVNTSGCESCALRLTCREFTSIIGILEVSFEISGNYSTNSTLLVFDRPLTRMALNHRCSGVNHCSFILTKDCPGADRWGFGNLSVKYACISERRVTKYCNREIILPSIETIGISQGFVHNPGYPRFYVGGDECRWRIRAPPLQKLKIIIFDLFLVGDPNKEACSDVLRIGDPAQLIFSSCQQQEPPAEVVSLDDTLDIILIPSRTESILPTRGVLFFYSAVGCPTPRIPDDGYLVYRNDTVAEFSCCVGYAFPDTKRRFKLIKCVGHQWDTILPLPNCNNFSDIIDNISSTELLPSATRNMVSESTLKEIVIPVIIIVILFIINSVVLFIIFRYRQRKSTAFTEAELSSLPITETT